ncbi:MAG: Crp/Fnr family transcriptional regulator [Gammaproteobacteria bacterium]|nr:MAG: Crp/Fnr family transcriptional regulator [Gammaproteobacteria bacterium]
MKNSLPLYKTCRHRLAQTLLFNSLSLDMLDDMLASFRFESWNKGVIRDSGLANRRFYVILDGRLELTQVNPGSGKQVVLMILREGDVYDVLSLLDGKENPVIPTSLDDVKLISAPVEAVRQWVSEHPEFNRNLFPYLGRQIRLREALVEDISLYDTHARLARMILRYATVDSKPSDDVADGLDVDLLHDLSNEELARMIGSARQVVNRHLQSMKRDGVLHYENHHLIIDDLRKLRRHADDLGRQYSQAG